jgi:hypothetical protein
MFCTPRQHHEQPRPRRYGVPTIHANFSCQRWPKRSRGRESREIAARSEGNRQYAGEVDPNNLCFRRGIL